MTTAPTRRSVPAAWLVPALVLAACAASRPPAPPPAPRLPRLLPRSSVAAVLAHRAELGLDDEQVRRLEGLDEDLAARPAGGAAPARPVRPPDDAAGGPGSQGGPGAPGGPASPEAGGAAGSGRHHGGGRPGGGERRDAPRPAADPQAAWDEADREAFLRAAGALRPDQRERATEIAERYREELYEERASRRGVR